MSRFLHLLIIKKMAISNNETIKKYPLFIWQFTKKA